MSQIFDSLTRRRRARTSESGGRPTAHGDAVLATLGYARPGRNRGKRLALLIGAVVISLTTWFGLSRPPNPTPASQARSAPPERQGPHAPGTPGAGTAEARVETHPVTPDSPAPPTPAGAALAVAPAVAVDTRPPSSPDATRDAPPPPPAQAAPPVDPGAARPPARADLMTEALYHHRAGDFERALVAYRTLIQQNELNAAAHNNLGLLYQQKNLLDDAARAFQRAIIIDGRYGLAHNNYGVTLLRQGRPDAAAAQFRTVLDLEPRNVDALVNLALAERAAGRTDAAKATLLRALGDAPRHAMAHYNLAVLHDDTGEPARALVHYRAFLEHAGAEQAERTAEVRARADALADR